VETPKLSQDRQEVEDGEFVGGNHQLAGLQLAQFNQGFLCVAAQVQQFFGVFAQYPSGIGQHSFAGRAVKQGLA
jgi:hypothetical protein